MLNVQTTVIAQQNVSTQQNATATATVTATATATTTTTATLLGDSLYTYNFVALLESLSIVIVRLILTSLEM
jgi:hypothetical protein